ncbi:hypothetical protein [Legionella santicrucis]|nr:hypothetical protein [Legionella santicrucis]
MVKATRFKENSHVTLKIIGFGDTAFRSLTLCLVLDLLAESGDN